MDRNYNKLVRDNIPDIIIGNGENPIIKILSDDEYKQELEKKLYEEYKEVLNTTTGDERIEELADMLEIIIALAKLEDKTLDDVVEVAKAKRLKRGGFDKKIYLEKVIKQKNGDTVLEESNYIKFKNLNNNEVLHLYTKKPFNFNGSKVEKDKLKAQYTEIQKILNCSISKIIKPIQTHTNIVKKVDSTNLNDNFENVDGLITNLKGIALVTSLADCQGILLYDKNKKVIGNIHSGWKGTLNRIICNAVELMVKEYYCNVKDIEIYICPSILKCCFEVEEDVKEQFVLNFKDINIERFIYKGNIKNKKQKYFIDTISLNIEILKREGILSKNIYNSNICTKCNNNKFNSHRADKEDGRNIALIMLK